MKYSKSFRNAILRKALPLENRSVYSVAKEAGIAVVTINSWLASLKSGTLTVEQDDDGPVNERCFKEKLDLLLEYQRLPEEEIGEWLRQRGLHSEHFALFWQELTTNMANKSDEKKSASRNSRKRLSSRKKNYNERNQRWRKSLRF